MIDIEQALDLVFKHAQPTSTEARSATESVSLEDAVGRYLAADVVSDIDSPPYDKSMMDGFALRADDLAEAGRVLQIVEEITAGNTPSVVVTPGTASRIMTGAPIPDGADAVVMVEKTEMVDSGADRPQVRILAQGIPSSANIIRQATMMSRGQTILSRSTRLSAIHVGLLAEAGAATVQAYRRPSVSVLATGDELVTPDVVPGPSQIRNSNGPMISSMASDLGVAVDHIGIALDTREDLESKVARGLESDVLILSGGVSEGVLDLVPSVLAAAGVQQVFHKVRIKPGKPIWFGVRERPDRKQLVFGLPGNPVSSLVGFQMFARPAINCLAGATVERTEKLTALLDGSHQHRGDRPTLWPGRMSHEASSLRAAPLNWKGSADLCTLGSANCLILFSGASREFESGTPVEVVPF